MKLKILHAWHTLGTVYTLYKGRWRQKNLKYFVKHEQKLWKLSFDIYKEACWNIGMMKHGSEMKELATAENVYMSRSFP